jgi:hypothetical protein
MRYARAIRRTAAFVVHVAGVDVVQSGFERDVARTRECRRRRGVDVSHLVVGMKRGEVQRHIRAEFFHDPAALRAEFLVGIIFARNQQRGDFEPHAGFVFQIHQRVEHGLQVCGALLEIKFVGEGLEIDIGRVHFGVELSARCIVHIARGDRDGLDAHRMAGIGDVHRVFRENHRIVVGEAHALAAGFECRLRDGLGRGLIGKAVHVA